jgi:hypothetical protein
MSRLILIWILSSYVPTTTPDLAARFHTIIFLGTPHRGANSAQLLNNILRTSISHGPKTYVSDLIANSAVLQGINDEFRQVHQGLVLYSFFETVPTNLGMSNDLIVQKESAVLGERQTLTLQDESNNMPQGYLTSAYNY